MQIENVFSKQEISEKKVLGEKKVLVTASLVVGGPASDADHISTNLRPKRKRSLDSLRPLDSSYLWFLFPCGEETLYIVMYVHYRGNTN